MSDANFPHCGTPHRCCGTNKTIQAPLCLEREAHNQTKRELNSVRAKFVAALDGRDMANEEADKLRELLASEKITRDHIIKRGFEMQKERDEAREALEYIANAGLSARHIEDYAKEFLARIK